MFQAADTIRSAGPIRDLATDDLQFMETRLALHEPDIPQLRTSLEDSKTSCAKLANLKIRKSKARKFGVPRFFNAPTVSISASSERAFGVAGVTSRSELEGPENLNSQIA